MVQFKTKCTKCKVNYVTVSNRNAYGAICFDCNKKSMEGDIKDPAMKKMFDIPEEMYRQSNFLCSIKSNYIRFGNLSEKQIEFFNKVVGDMKDKAATKPTKDKKEVKGFDISEIPAAPVSMRAERLAKKKKA